MNSLSSPSQQRETWLLVGALIVLVAALALAWRCFTRLHGCVVDDLKVTITYPEDGSRVPRGRHSLVEGTYSGNLIGCEIWVLARPESDRKYYPQAINPWWLTSGGCYKVSVQSFPVGLSQGRWSTLFFDTSAETLDLMAMVTNTGSAADEYFKQWVQRACEGPFPGGIKVLPWPLTKMDTITIRTK
jgi:hypothetical protein